MRPHARFEHGVPHVDRLFPERPDPVAVPTGVKDLVPGPHRVHEHVEAAVLLVHALEHAGHGLVVEVVTTDGDAAATGLGDAGRGLLHRAAEVHRRCPLRRPTSDVHGGAGLTEPDRHAFADAATRAGHDRDCIAQGLVRAHGEDATEGAAAATLPTVAATPSLRRRSRRAG
jgi:hypothetical protein